MSRFRYADGLNPPAPFVQVSIVRPDHGFMLENLPGQIDTAADRTVLPARLVTALELAPIREVSIGGIGGAVLQLLVYLVELTILELPTLTVQVLGVEGDPYVLIGRDVLNLYRIHLDGPGQTLEIG